MTGKFWFGPVLGVALAALVVTGCTGHAGFEEGEDSDHASVGEGVSEREDGELGGEHGDRLEGNGSGEEGGEEGGEHRSSEESGSEGPDGGGEDGEHRSGNAGGSEGPDGGGEDGEHGSGSGEGGEHRSGGEGGSEGSDGGGESSEAAMSSPITPLEQQWNGVIGGLAVSMRYEAATESVHATVRNTLSETLCYVQAEPHLKAGTVTVGELGPDKLGDLSPGQEATSSLPVAGEPELAGVFYDGYVLHMEVFDCSGPGPAAHTGGEGAEGSGEHSPGGERDESAGVGGEEGSGADSLGLDETFDAVRSGARLILSYDASSNSFVGTAENTTDGVLARVRIEVHLSNGTELGPTTPTDMAPGQVLAVNLAATSASFTGWTAHAEVGAGEHGAGGEEGRGEEGESGEEQGGSGEEGSGEEGSGEEGGGEEGESGEEHGGDGEEGGEHGDGGERRGDG